MQLLPELERGGMTEVLTAVKKGTSPYLSGQSFVSVVKPFLSAVYICDKDGVSHTFVVKKVEKKFCGKKKLPANLCV